MLILLSVRHSKFYRGRRGWTCTWLDPAQGPSWRSPPSVASCSLLTLSQDRPLHATGLPNLMFVRRIRECHLKGAPLIIAVASPIRPQESLLDTLHKLWRTMAVWYHFPTQLTTFDSVPIHNTWVSGFKLFMSPRLHLPWPPTTCFALALAIVGDINFRRWVVFNCDIYHQPYS